MSKQVIKVEVGIVLGIKDARKLDKALSKAINPHPPINPYPAYKGSLPPRYC